MAFDRPRTACIRAVAFLSSLTRRVMLRGRTWPFRRFLLDTRLTMIIAPFNPAGSSGSLPYVTVLLWPTCAIVRQCVAGVNGRGLWTFTAIRPPVTMSASRRYTIWRFLSLIAAPPRLHGLGSASFFRGSAAAIVRLCVAGVKRKWQRSDGKESFLTGLRAVATMTTAGD